jgi:single-strand DNA-binding protein
MQNSVCLVGRIANDIEVKTFDSGDRSTSFSLAVQRNYKNKDGEYECDFINCQARNGTADLLFKYFRKGDFCPIVGELRTRKYEKDGVNHTVTFVAVNSITFVGGKNDGASAPVVSAPSDDNPFGDATFTTGSDDDLPF